jgi:hypothetical protein
MINETKLRDTLIILAENVKKHHEILSLVMDETAALRETVRGLDPTFDDVFEKQKADLSSAEFRRQAAQLYDDLIQLLKAGLVC